MNRVLLDQGLAPAAAVLLRQDGWDAVHVCEIGMQAADDAAILDTARIADRVCVTLDHDFHAHLAMARSGRPSVVLLRAQGLNANAQADLIRSVWQHSGEALRQGAAVSADVTSIRIRRLPLR